MALESFAQIRPNSPTFFPLFLEYFRQAFARWRQGTVSPLRLPQTETYTRTSSRLVSCRFISLTLSFSACCVMYNKVFWSFSQFPVQQQQSRMIILYFGLNHHSIGRLIREMAPRQAVVGQPDWVRKESISRILRASTTITTTTM